MSEREVYRVAQDLRSGNAEDAANVMRRELQQNPQAAQREAREANAMAGPNARLHIGSRSNGDMAVVDNSGRTVSHIGRPFDNYNSGYNNGYDNRSGSGIGRIANDLARGDAQDAANSLRAMMRYSNDNPQRLINQVNQLADQQAARYGYRSAMEHIGMNRNGDIAVVDYNGRAVARVGNAYENGYGNNNYDRNQGYYDRNQGYDRNQAYDRNQGYYGNQGYDRNQGYYNRNQDYYGNQGYDRNQGYYGNQGYDRNQAYYDRLNQSYYSGGSYDGRQSYYPNQNYSSSYYGRQNYSSGYYDGNSGYSSFRGNGGTAAIAGIAALGLMALVNRNNNNNRYHGRW